MTSTELQQHFAALSTALEVNNCCAADDFAVVVPSRRCIRLGRKIAGVRQWR